MNYLRFCFMLVLLLAAAPSTTLASDATYSFTTIDVPGGIGASAHGINEAGQITGHFFLRAQSGAHGFLYSGGRFTTLDAPSVGGTIPYDINDAGQVVGWFGDLSGNDHGFLYSGGNFTTLDVPGASGKTTAHGINDAGQIVGWYFNGGKHGFLYSAGRFTTIDVPDAIATAALGINNSGQIAGQFEDAAGHWHGFLFSAGSFTTLDLPGAAGTQPTCINNAGQIAGQFEDAAGDMHGFLYSGGSFTTLDVPGAVAWLGGTHASGINDAGQIVGGFSDNADSHGFLALPSFSANKNLGSCDCGVASAGNGEGNPINSGTGNKYQAETDFVGAANAGLSLTRFYNSADTTGSAFGTGWHSTWHRGLAVAASGASVTVTRADGRQDIFIKNSEGVYLPTPDVTTTLTPVLDAIGAQTGWSLKLADDSIEAYDLSGKLFSITTRAGLVTALAYNSSSQLTTVTGPFGHTLKFAYDGNNRVNRVTAPDGRAYAYAYGSSNNLISVTYPDSSLRQYLYGNASFPHALTGIIDELRNNFAAWGYDSQGRATSSQHAGGADLTTLAYNSDGTTTVTDARGNAHSYTSTTKFGLVKPTALSGAPVQTSGGKAFTYDTNGFIAGRTNWRNVPTIYTHDARGNETSRTEAAGTGLARTINTTWHPTFHLPAQISEPGRTTNFTYDAKGNLLTKTITAGALTRTWSYTYGALGQVLTAADPRGNVTTYTYDAHGNLATLTNALGHVTNFSNYDGAGRLLRQVDPNGVVMTFTYDPRGRLTSKTEAALTWTYSYDAAGNLTRVTQPDGSYVVFAYDAAHRLIGMTDALGNRIAYTLDAAGNVTREQAFDSGSVQRRVRSFAYDSVNRLVRSFGAQGQTTSYAYDLEGNLVSATDPLTHRNLYAYDALNRLVRQTDANSGVTALAYDPLDHLTLVSDPRGLRTGYAWTGLDDQTRVVSPDTGVTARTFDAAGNVLTSTDARGVQATYAYDALNRKLSETFPSGVTTSWQYDQGVNGKGRLTKITDPSGSTTFAYDANGHVVQKQQIIAGLTRTTRYAYDAGGRLSTITYPSGRQVAYAYDAAGRVTGLSTGAQAIVSAVTYAPFGGVTGWNMANGGPYRRAIDQNNRIAAYLMPGARTINLSYDAASRIVGMTDNQRPAKTFGYDALDRLTSYAGGTQTQSYAYDADGNRTSATLQDDASTRNLTYAYGTTSNRILSIGGASTETFSYTASGSTTAHTGGAANYAFLYDARGRLMRSTVGALVKIYPINGLGQRVAKSNPANAADRTFFAYDEAGHLIGEYGPAGALLEETVWLGDLPVATFQPSGTFYIAPDHLGAPQQITNASRQVVWQWDRDPFGNGAPTGTITYNLRFPGQYYDAETGLNYNYFRDYDPKLGRYVQSDPIGLSGGLNRYVHVFSNPINYSDPLGLEAIFRYSDGTTRTANTATEFANIAKGSANGSLDAVIIKGHGNSESQNFNPNDSDSDEGLIYNGESVKLIDNHHRTVGDIGDLLGGKFDLNGSNLLTLQGCNAASGDDNITRASSRQLPGVRVMGSRSYTLMLKVIGISIAPAGDKLYVNGELR